MTDTGNDDTEQKRYIADGFQSAGPGTVRTEPGGGTLDTGYNNPDLPNHSPDGFQVGYGGSGPAQLAAALLNDVHDAETANRFYQEFKWDVVAGLDDDWQLTEQTIRNWVEKKRNLAGNE